MTIQTTSGGIEFVRTPDDRFEGLDDFPYEPKYGTVDGLRMAYIDEGPEDAHPVVLLHGEPSWSYLYRRMIPILLDAGYRVIAPDLIGFGRSDKPTEPGYYTYERHVANVEFFLDANVHEPCTIFAQDWGGLIGLRLVGLQPERFERVVIGNTGLPVGESLGEGFDFWLAFSQASQLTDIGGLFRRAVAARELSDHEIAAYEAPFPTADHRVGAVVFPTLVPITPEHAGVAENVEAWAGLDAFEKPFLTLWCPEDPVLGGLAAEFIERVPGAEGQPHQDFTPGGHFLQDDQGEAIAAAMVDWMAS